MFERYTEKARRVIFFARYEASEFRSAEITTEHLLLGLLREDKDLLAGYVATTLRAEALRERMRAEVGERKPVSTSDDLPLNRAAKRVLSCADEEAARLGHKHVGNEHFLLGLLGEDDSPAAKILREHGASLEDARRKIEEDGPWPGSGRGGLDAEVGHFLRGGGNRNVELVGEDGAVLATIPWNPNLPRVRVGACVEVGVEGRARRYRILDASWEAAQAGDTRESGGRLRLVVREEKG